MNKKKSRVEKRRERKEEEKVLPFTLWLIKRPIPKVPFSVVASILNEQLVFSFCSLCIVLAFLVSYFSSSASSSCFFKLFVFLGYGRVHLPHLLSSMFKIIHCNNNIRNITQTKNQKG